jgi:predicted MPP superfamily phosphohydrolase
LCLAGIDDPGEGWTDREAESPEIERLAKQIPNEITSLLLIHRPSFFRQAARLGFPVCLAGHTHGGQVSFPGAQHHNPSRLIARWTRGLFQDGDSLLYVNRGLGVAGPPIRLNCPREIALLRLVERK